MIVIVHTYIHGAVSGCFEFESTNQRKVRGSASGSLRLRYLQESTIPTTCVCACAREREGGEGGREGEGEINIKMPHSIHHQYLSEAEYESKAAS